MNIIFRLIGAIVFIWLLAFVIQEVRHINFNKNSNHATTYLFGDRIWDSFYTAKAGPGAWSNLAGYKIGDDYYCCCDNRFLGIRTQDIVIRCKNKSTYDDACNAASHGNITVFVCDKRLKEEKHCNNEFVFLFDNKNKSYYVHLPADMHAEEI